MKPLRIYNLMEDGINTGLLDLIYRTGMSGISYIMQDNSEMLNIEGSTIHFLEFNTVDSRRIVYLNMETEIKRDRIEKILLSFFSDSWREQFELRKRCRSEFKHNCIAYRGSQGVFYEIWKLKRNYPKVTHIHTPPAGQALEVRNLKRNRSKERMENIPTWDSLIQLSGKAGKCFTPVSQGHAPRGFGEKSSSLCSGIFPKNLDTPEAFTFSSPTVG